MAEQEVETEDNPLKDSFLKFSIKINGSISLRKN